MFLDAAPFNGLLDFRQEFVGGYGKNGAGKCIHGAEECVGQRFLLCAQHLAAPKTRTYRENPAWLDFQACSYGPCSGCAAILGPQCPCTNYTSFPEYQKNDIMKDCAATTGIDWAALEACATGAVGEQLLIASANASTAAGVVYGLQGLPVVHIVNGATGGDTRVKTKQPIPIVCGPTPKEVLAVVCDALPDPKPSNCTTAKDADVPVASGDPRDPGVAAFTSGKEGYACYRIPSIIRLPSGNLMIFAEGRKFSCADHDWNDVVYKISQDDGATWGPLQVLYGESTPAKHVTLGNPSPVVVDNAHVVIAFCRDNKAVLTLRSDDATGTSWPSTPVDVSASVMKKDWTWVATGPPQALQLASGRVVVAADHRPDPGASNGGAHTMYSDDKGATWKMSSNFVPGGNECEVARAPDGTLVMNARSVGGKRLIAWSKDDGGSWSAPDATAFSGDHKLSGDCEGSTIRIPGTDLLAFSTPYTTEHARANMTIFTSGDSGHSWDAGTININDQAPAAYSALLPINSTHVGLVYEAGGYKTLQYTVVQLR